MRRPREYPHQDCVECGIPLCDPQVPADGTCAQCGKPRRPERSRRYGKATAELDPFCSSECARAWYGVSLNSERYSTGLGGSMGNKRI